MNEDTQTSNNKSRSNSRRWPKAILLLFIVFILFLLLLYILLQLKPVQNWITDKTTQRLSEKTGIHFDIQDLDFSIYDGLILENVLISEGPDSKDTLAYLGSFSSSLGTNLLSVLDNKLYLTELNVKDAYIYVKTHPDSTQSNLANLIDKLSSSEKTVGNKRKQPLEIGLDKVYFENIRIVEDNSLSGAFREMRLKQGRIDIEELNIGENRFVINELLLSEPYVKITKNQGQASGRIINDSIVLEPIKASPKLDLKLHFVEISNGQFYFDDWTEGSNTKEQALDTKHIALSNFNVNADSTSINFPLKVKSSIKSLTLIEDGGFEIKQLDVEQLIIDDKKVLLDNFVIETESSRLGENLEFSYNELEDFKKFASQIDIDSELKNTRLAFSDLAYFFPEIKGSPFYKLNKNRWLQLSGRIRGTIDDMDADDLDLSFADLVKLKGALSTSDLTNASNALFNLRLDNINTSLVNLKKVIPGFNPPPRFYKLDPINFEGDIDGFFKDFVLFGTLNSPLGRIELDTRFDFKNGTDIAEYSGDVALENFNVQAWTENPDFGFATFEASIKNGKGLKLDKLDTDLNAQLKSFDFKGYTYSDVTLDGTFRENLFDGEFSSKDPNAKMDFAGKINVNNGAISSDFKSNIENVDLLALNLSKDFTTLHGNIDMDLAGSKQENLVGSATVNNLSLIYKEKLFEFDSLFINSAPNINGNRNINITSDWINGSVDGDINISNLVSSFKTHFVYAHPKWAQKLNIVKGPDSIASQQFRYKFKIKDTKDYLELVNVKDLNFKGVKLEGKVNTEDHLYQSDINIVDLNYKDMNFNNLQLNLSETKKKSNHLINLQKFIKGNTELTPIELIVEAEGDNVELSISTNEIIDSIESIDLTIQAYPRGDEIIGKIADGEIKMLSSTWDINPANEIIYGDKSLEISGFVFSDDYRSIVIDDINKKGIFVDLSRFNFLMINNIIDYDKIDFAGEGNVVVYKENLFEPSSTNLKVNIPEFTLNDVDYGALTLSVRDEEDKVYLDSLSLLRDYDDMSLLVRGDYNKKSKALDGLVAGKALGLKTFEFIIPDGISNTGGYVDVDAVLSGTIEDIKLNGVGQASKGTTTIDYLGAELYLGEEKFIVTDKVIDLTGGTLRDRLGNVAQITGTLNHNLFTDFTSNLKMSANNFLALDTEKFDNPSYYGQGIGAVTVDFSGPFSSTDIVVNATSKIGTVINIPVGDVYADFDESIIQQVDRNSILNPKEDTTIVEIKKLEGVDVRMNLTITQDAKINIIFDESTNDIMRGRGDGNMRVVISRQGDFNIFGEYIIDEGDYLFTYFGGFISKPFTVKKGGKITWTGDPINANIDLEANYEQLRAPVNVFLAEFLPPQAEADARQRTDINLSMFLTGTLYKPTVDFDIAFPELQGDLKTLADSKMRILRTNEADLNEQVAGLIMFGSFLPSSSLGNTVGSTSGLVRTGYNTLSEMISNQLSYILSGFLQEALTEDGFISGVDFELGFSKNSEFSADLNQVNNNSAGILPDEIEVHLKPRFKDDRWELDYGTSYVNRTASTINNYVIHDLNIGFYLTEDRRLKVRAYSKWDQNINGDRGYKSGVGLNFRKEFGSLTDFKNELSKDLGKLKKK